LNHHYSEVLPAVLDSELGVDVFERSNVLVSVLVHVDFSPLVCAGNVWEVGSPVGVVLEGLGHTIIQPVSVRGGEGAMDIVWMVASPVAKCKVTNLTAKFPVVSIIFNVSSRLLVPEFLMRVFLNPLIKIAWYSWEIMETWGTNSVLILASDDQRSTLLLSGDGVEVHASAWLHGGGNWLSNLLSEFWDSVTLNNLNIEINIGSERDWLSSNWSPGESGTINVV